MSKKKSRSLIDEFIDISIVFSVFSDILCVNYKVERFYLSIERIK